MSEFKNTFSNKNAKYGVTIYYDTKENHPDFPLEVGLEDYDVYTIDETCFWSKDDLIEYLKNDMMLVAGGGYKTNTIKNVKFKIEKL